MSTASWLRTCWPETRRLSIRQYATAASTDSGSHPRWRGRRRRAATTLLFRPSRSDARREGCEEAVANAKERVEGFGEALANAGEPVPVEEDLIPAAIVRAQANTPVLA